MKCKRFLLDDFEIQTMSHFTLDILEGILLQMNTEDFNYPLWTLHPPIEVEGFQEALISICDVDGDLINSNLFFLSLCESKNPKEKFLELILEMRKMEKEKSIRNIIFHLYFIQQCNFFFETGNKDKLLTLSKNRDEFYTSPLNLRSIFGDQWRKYYHPKKVI